jgi:hypothetical protein
MIARCHPSRPAHRIFSPRPRDPDRPALFRDAQSAASTSRVAILGPRPQTVSTLDTNTIPPRDTRGAVATCATRPMVSPPSYSVPTCHCLAERSPLSRTVEAVCPATLFETNALEASVEAGAPSEFGRGTRTTCNCGK